MKQYTWETDKYEEVWSNGKFDTIAECFEDASQVCQGQHIVGLYISECVPYDTYKVDVDMILEDLENMAYYVVGDASEGWFSGVTKEQEEELSLKIGKVLKEWLLEHGLEPGFYRLENVRYVEAGQ